MKAERMKAQITMILGAPTLTLDGPVNMAVFTHVPPSITPSLHLALDAADRTHLAAVLVKSLSDDELRHISEVVQRQMRKLHCREEAITEEAKALQGVGA